MTQHIHSYPSIFSLGHSAVASLTDGPVVVEEKIDGSQFSFGLDAESGEILARSKGKDLVVDEPEKMFRMAVESVKERAHLLCPGWIYRGEYLAKPKHNTLAYDRAPVGNVILFDVNPGLEMYLSPNERTEEAARIGLESVPVLYEGRLQSVDAFR